MYNPRTENCVCVCVCVTFLFVLSLKCIVSGSVWSVRVGSECVCEWMSGNVLLCDVMFLVATQDWDLFLKGVKFDLLWLSVLRDALVLQVDFIVSLKL